MASRLSQPLEVKVISGRPLRESSRLMEAGQALPSYVGEAEEVRALRVRLAQLPPEGMIGTSVASKTPWSQEILVTGDKAKDSRLVKVTTHSLLYMYIIDTFCLVHLLLMHSTS